jgi:hypothetical protein
MASVSPLPAAKLYFSECRRYSGLSRSISPRMALDNASSEAQALPITGRPIQASVTERQLWAPACSQRRESQWLHFMEILTTSIAQPLIC